jgi:hypothetical protein
MLTASTARLENSFVSSWVQNNFSTALPNANRGNAIRVEYLIENY